MAACQGENYQEAGLMETSVLKLVVDTDVRDREIGRLGDDLDRLKSGAKNAGDGIGVLDIAMGNLVAGAATATLDFLQQGAAAAFEFGKEAIDLASSAAETASLLDTVLGPSFESYEKQLNSIADATGASVNELKEGTKIFAVLAESAGFAQSEAANLAATTGGIALDLNSFFDKDNALEAIGQAYKGESEGLAQFGIDVRVAALEDVALRKGIIETGEALDKQSTILAVNAAIQEQAAKAMGDAARTADGFANTQRALNAEFQDFKVEVGQDLLEALAPAQKELLGMARTTLPAVADSLGKGIKSTTEFAVGLREMGAGAAQFVQESQLVKGAVIELVDQFNFLNLPVENLSPLGLLLAPVGGSSLLDGIEFLRQSGAETLALAEATERLNSTRSTGSGGRGGRGSFVQETESVENFVSTLQNPIDTLNEINELASTTFSEVDFSSFTDAFGGEIVTDIDEIGNALDRVTTRVGGLIQKSAEFTTSDFFGTTVDEDGFFTEAAKAAGNNISIGTTIEFLREDGTPIEDIRETAGELLENQLAQSLAIKLDAGLIDEEQYKEQVATIASELESLEDPLLIVEQGAGAISDALNDLNSDFQSTLTFQLEGYEELLNAKAIIEELSGQQIGGNDLPTSSTITSGPSTTDSSISSIARRRGGPS